MGATPSGIPFYQCCHYSGLIPTSNHSPFTIIWLLFTAKVIEAHTSHDYRNTLERIVLSGVNMIVVSVCVHGIQLLSFMLCVLCVLD